MAKIEVRETEGGNLVRDVPVHTREFAIIDDPVHDPTERAKIREAAQEWILENYQTHLPYHGDLPKVDYATLQAAVQEYWENCSPTPEICEWLQNLLFSEVRGNMAVTPEYEAIAGHELAFRPKRQPKFQPIKIEQSEISLTDIPAIVEQKMSACCYRDAPVDWLKAKQRAFALPQQKAPFTNMRKVLSVLSAANVYAPSCSGFYRVSCYELIVGHVRIYCCSDHIQIGEYIVRTNPSAIPNS